MLDHRSSRSYGQGSGYRDDYAYQNRGQLYDRSHYGDYHGHGDQRYYEDDNYYDDSRGGYGGGSSHRGRGGRYDDSGWHGGGDQQSRYTYRAADVQQTRPNTYDTTSNASSANQPNAANDILLVELLIAFQYLLF